MNERNVVRARADVRHEVADPFATLAVLLPAPGAGHAIAWIALKQLDLLARIEGLAVAANELGLVIEGIDLADNAGTEDLQHTPGLGG